MVRVRDRPARNDEMVCFGFGSRGEMQKMRRARRRVQKETKKKNPRRRIHTHL